MRKNFDLISKMDHLLQVIEEREEEQHSSDDNASMTTRHGRGSSLRRSLFPLGGGSSSSSRSRESRRLPRQQHQCELQHHQQQQPQPQRQQGKLAQPASGSSPKYLIRHHQTRLAAAAAAAAAASAAGSGTGSGAGSRGRSSRTVDLMQDQVDELEERVEQLQAEVAKRDQAGSALEAEVARLKSKLDQRAVDMVMLQHQLQASEARVQQQARIIDTDTQLKATWEIIQMHDALLGQLTGLVVQASTASHSVCQVWQLARRDPYTHAEATIQALQVSMESLTAVVALKDKWLRDHLPPVNLQRLQLAQDAAAAAAAEAAASGMRVPQAAAAPPAAGSSEGRSAVGKGFANLIDCLSTSINSSRQESPKMPQVPEQGSERLDCQGRYAACSTARMDAAALGPMHSEPHRPQAAVQSPTGSSSSSSRGRYLQLYQQLQQQEYQQEEHQGCQQDYWQQQQQQQQQPHHHHSRQQQQQHERCDDRQLYSNSSSHRSTDRHHRSSSHHSQTLPQATPRAAHGLSPAGTAPVAASTREGLLRSIEERRRRIQELQVKLQHQNPSARQQDAVSVLVSNLLCGGSLPASPACVRGGGYDGQDAYPPAAQLRPRTTPPRASYGQPSSPTRRESASYTPPCTSSAAPRRHSVSTMHHHVPEFGSSSIGASGMLAAVPQQGPAGSPWHLDAKEKAALASIMRGESCAMSRTLSTSAGLDHYSYASAARARKARSSNGCNGPTPRCSDDSIGSWRLDALMTS